MHENLSQAQSFLEFSSHQDLVSFFLLRESSERFAINCYLVARLVLDRRRAVLMCTSERTTMSDDAIMVHDNCNVGYQCL